MARNGHWVQRLADRADLYGEILPGVPVVELAGDGRVLVERHRGVTEYSGERVCIELSYGSVSICGCGLELTRMSKDFLVIAGRIEEIKICRRCRR